ALFQFLKPGSNDGSKRRRSSLFASWFRNVILKGVARLLHGNTFLKLTEPVQGDVDLFGWSLVSLSLGLGQHHHEVFPVRRDVIGMRSQEDSLNWQRHGFSKYETRLSGNLHRLDSRSSGSQGGSVCIDRIDPTGG